MIEQKESLKVISFMDGKAFFDELNIEENINSIQTDLVPQLEIEKHRYSDKQY